jgi:hypothetical protein
MEQAHTGLGGRHTARGYRAAQASRRAADRALGFPLLAKANQSEAQDNGGNAESHGEPDPIL